MDPQVSGSGGAPLCSVARAGAGRTQKLSYRESVRQVIDAARAAAWRVVARWRSDGTCGALLGVRVAYRIQ